MKGFVAVLLVLLATLAGGALGGLAGVAMDRYPALGLTPEGFWHTDPESVWAWAILVGAALGAVAAAAAFALPLRRRQA